MENKPQLCLKCGGSVTWLQGGLGYCQTCGFQGEESKPQPDAALKSQVLFWVLLFAPGVVSLTEYWYSGTPDNSLQLRLALGLGNCAVGIVSSLYCGIWLAKRFCKSTTFRASAAFGLALGIGIVNFFIVLAGCALRA